MDSPVESLRVGTVCLEIAWHGPRDSAGPVIECIPPRGSSIHATFPSQISRSTMPFESVIFERSPIHAIGGI